MSRSLKMTIAGTLLLLSSCSGSRKFESAIVKRIEQCPKHSDCTFAMSDVTHFEWDKFCAFKYTATADDERRALGTDSRADLERQIVFLRHGRIVFRERQPTNVEHPIRDEVIFDIPDDVNVRCYQHGVRFRVIEQTGPDGRYFLLEAVS